MSRHMSKVFTWMNANRSFRNAFLPPGNVISFIWCKLCVRECSSTSAAEFSLTNRWGTKIKVDFPELVNATLRFNSQCPIFKVSFYKTNVEATGDGYHIVKVPNDFNMLNENSFVNTEYTCLRNWGLTLIQTTDFTAFEEVKSLALNQTLETLSICPRTITFDWCGL